MASLKRRVVVAIRRRNTRISIGVYVFADNKWIWTR